MKRNKKYYIRKAHRWLGVTIGIQFLLWTVGGLYFSWTNLDEIHGDHFKSTTELPVVSAGQLQTLDSLMSIYQLEIRMIRQTPYLWINDSILLNASTKAQKNGITEEEANWIARMHILPEYTISNTELLTEVDNHHEYREGKLPVWAVSFDGPDKLVAYVTQEDGAFETVRHRSWRWFDFLWMFHTMDYQGRDDFNNILIRAYSLFGLFTVASGFTLFFLTMKRSNRKRGNIKMNISN